jgi:hypothetical protein
MMGHRQVEQAALFYEFSLEAHVPLPTRLQFDRPDPTPNSDDIDFYGKWKEGPTLM